MTERRLTGGRYRRRKDARTPKRESATKVPPRGVPMAGSRQGQNVARLRERQALEESGDIAATDRRPRHKTTKET